MVKTKDFSDIVHQKGRELYRDMPWRRDTRPYYILVSELMLQQTQVDRVIPKFEAFVARFPDEQALADASLADVLILWSGLGYNRRAKYLHDAAKMVVAQWGGRFFDTPNALLQLPGVGKGTAGAILAYAFNQPVAFVETNVRTVYFQHFFTNGEKVADTEIVRLLEQTLDHDNPREFYWALMDYGTWLKKNGASRMAQSKHYKKQPPLKGSIREVRGQIVQLLTTGDMAVDTVKLRVSADERFTTALAGLLRDGLIVQRGNYLHLTK
jgi:A/G-specific adenine glycosylase